MGKKATIVTKIAGLTDGGENTAAEVRALLTEFLDDVFTTPVYDTLISQTYITAVPHPEISSGSLKAYIWIRQIGGQIRMDGYFHNESASVLNNTIIFQFKDNDFVPDDRNDPTESAPFLTHGIGTDTTGQRVRFVIGKIDGVNVFKIEGQMTFAKTYFSVTYDQKQ